VVVAETERVLSGNGAQPAAQPSTQAAPPVPAPKAQKQAATAFICPHCGAEFAIALKFCGECGKEMS
jgi:hypothetical protein